MILKKILIVFLLVMILQESGAQTMVIPAKKQAKPILLVGGTAHLGNGNVIQNAAIGFDKGKLTLVSESSSTIDRSGYEVIDVQGKHIYPGFILPSIELGLSEVSSVRATVDTRETGQLNPNVRAIVAYNTDSELIPTLRFNGLLLAQVRPTGGLIAGSSSVVQLDAWNWEDAVIKEDDGIFMSWPNRESRQFDPATLSVKNQPNKQYPETIQKFDELFTEAIAYGKSQESREVNLKLAAMQGLFDGSTRLFITTNEAKNIIESVKFAKERGVKKIVIVGGSQAYMVKIFLKENDIPVVLGGVHSLPARSHDDLDMPYKMANILTKAGVLTSLTYRGVMGSRNLPFIAGTSAAYGLGKEEALKLITSNAAKILGIDDRAGTLEKGKDATLFVSEGDALDMRTNILTHAYINGRAIQLDATQQALYKKYYDKYDGK